MYVGAQADPEAHGGEAPSVARIVVSALPGGCGVSFDYEVLTAAGTIAHNEHAILARTPAGNVVITAHSHADVATVIHETEPGYFPAADGAAPFPMAIRLDVPEPGHLVYSWSYGGRGEPMRVRDVGDVRRVS